MNLKQIIKEEVRRQLKESYYGSLGGNTNFNDKEMRKNVVDKELGDYDAYIQFKDKDYKTMKNTYASNASNWKEIWRSQSYQTNARLSPDKKVIHASIYDNGSIIGAIYIKK